MKHTAETSVIVSRLAQVNQSQVSGQRLELCWFKLPLLHKQNFTLTKGLSLRALT